MQSVRVVSALLLVCAGTVLAQAGVKVYPVQLAASFDSVAGMLVVHDAMLTFIDQERPEVSFAAERPMITGVTAEGDTATVQLSRSIRDRAGERNRLSFRFQAPSEAAALAEWFQGNAAAGASSATSAAAAGDMSFQARRKKRFGGADGRLVVTSERLIFESTDKIGESRQWQFKDIKELKQGNPYELEIVPFRGDKYNLELLGTPMDTQQFRQLTERVTSARIARR